MKLSRRFDLSTRGLGHMLEVMQVIQLLEFCLTTTYFVYKGKYYQQTHGAAMGSPVSPIVANLYMEDFEDIALSSAPNPSSVWIRYVDDTFVKIHEYHVDEFSAHINSINPKKQFTIEPELEGKLPFLDLCLHVQQEVCRVRQYRRRQEKGNKAYKTSPSGK